jgi:hypothetical protein
MAKKKALVIVLKGSGKNWLRFVSVYIVPPSGGIWSMVIIVAKRIIKLNV